MQEKCTGFMCIDNRLCVYIWTYPYNLYPDQLEFPTARPFFPLFPKVKKKPF